MNPQLFNDSQTKAYGLLWCNYEKTKCCYIHLISLHNMHEIIKYFIIFAGKQKTNGNEIHE